MENQLQTTKGSSLTNVRNLLSKPNYKKRFEEILGKKATGFMSSIINVSSSPSLINVDSNSIIASAVVAATLDLPIDPNLGFAYIVPYNDKKRGKIAQFQMGYKGFIQLAMRSGQYKTINATSVYDGDIKRFNRFTGEIEFNEENTNRKDIVGYIAYFKLNNGFEKYLYMTVEELKDHGLKYSQSYKSKNPNVSKNSLWSTDFDSMAIKTVLKLLISKFGILSIEMQNAVQADQAVINENVINGESIYGNATYVDNNKDIVNETSEEVHDEINENSGKKIIDVESKPVEEHKEEGNEPF